MRWGLLLLIIAMVGVPFAILYLVYGQPWWRLVGRFYHPGPLPSLLQRKEHPRDDAFHLARLPRRIDRRRVRQHRTANDLSDVVAARSRPAEDSMQVDGEAGPATHSAPTGLNVQDRRDHTDSWS